MASLLPIARLGPDNVNTSDAAVRGVVTLVWPYSASRKAFSILLVEPDFRLRHDKGQIRITFRKSCAKTLARAEIASGDELHLRLAGCKWSPEDSSAVRTPGRSAGWELAFDHKLHLQVTRDGKTETIEVDTTSDSPEPDPFLTPMAPRTPVMAASAISPPLSVKSVESWSSPAFLKKRTFDTALAPKPYDIFADDPTLGNERTTKRTKLGRGSQQWRFVARSPSPEPVSEQAEVVNVQQPSPQHNATSVVHLLASKSGGLLEPFGHVEDPTAQRAPMTSGFHRNTNLEDGEGSHQTIETTPSNPASENNQHHISVADIIAQKDVSDQTISFSDGQAAESELIKADIAQLASSNPPYAWDDTINNTSLLQDETRPIEALREPQERAITVQASEGLVFDETHGHQRDDARAWLPSSATQNSNLVNDATNSSIYTHQTPASSLEAPLADQGELATSNMNIGSIEGDPADDLTPSKGTGRISASAHIVPKSPRAPSLVYSAPEETFQQNDTTMFAEDQLVSDLLETGKYNESGTTDSFKKVKAEVYEHGSGVKEHSRPETQAEVNIEQHEDVAYMRSSPEAEPSLANLSAEILEDFANGYDDAIEGDEESEADVDGNAELFAHGRERHEERLEDEIDRTEDKAVQESDGRESDDEDDLGAGSEYDRATEPEIDDEQDGTEQFEDQRDAREESEAESDVTEGSKDGRGAEEEMEARQEVEYVEDDVDEFSWIADKGIDDVAEEPEDGLDADVVTTDDDDLDEEEDVAMRGQSISQASANTHLTTQIQEPVARAQSEVIELSSDDESADSEDEEAAKTGITTNDKSADGPAIEPDPSADIYTSMIDGPMVAIAETYQSAAQPTLDGTNGIEAHADVREDETETGSSKDGDDGQSFDEHQMDGNALDLDPNIQHVELEHTESALNIQDLSQETQGDMMDWEAASDTVFTASLNEEQTQVVQQRIEPQSGYRLSPKQPEEAVLVLGTQATQESLLPLPSDPIKAPTSARPVTPGQEPYSIEAHETDTETRPFNGPLLNIVQNSEVDSQGHVAVQDMTRSLLSSKSNVDETSLDKGTLAASLEEETPAENTINESIEATDPPRPADAESSDVSPRSNLRRSTRLKHASQDRESSPILSPGLQVEVRGQGKGRKRAAKQANTAQLDPEEVVEAKASPEAHGAGVTPDSTMPTGFDGAQDAGLQAKKVTRRSARSSKVRDPTYNVKQDQAEALQSQCESPSPRRVTKTTDTGKGKSHSPTAELDTQQQAVSRPRRQKRDMSLDPVSQQLLHEAEKAEEEVIENVEPLFSKGVRTKHAYISPLSNLAQYNRKVVDGSLAIIVGTSKPERAPDGPRDWHMSLYVTDGSMQEASQGLRTVQIFRPSKSALPTNAAADNVILLHNFRGQSQKRKPMLLSTNSSGWVVFGANGEVKNSGPPIEFDNEEADLARRLHSWWGSVLGEKKMRLRTNVMQARDAAKETARRKSGRRSVVRPGSLAHELRDGTVYPYTDTPLLSDDIEQ